MPTIGDSSSIDISKINQVLDKAADTIIEARGDDPFVSRKDIKNKVATLEGEEKVLVDMLYRFTDHRDSKPYARVTEKKVKATLAYAKEKLIKRLDKDNDSKLNNEEIGKMSRIGKLAASIAKKTAMPPATPPATEGFGEVLDDAISKELVQIKQKDGQIQSFRVTSDWDSPKPSELVKEILKQPNLSQLSEFSLGLINEFDHNDSYGTSLDLIKAEGPFECVTDVKIGDFEFPDDSEISWVNIGNVSSVFEAAPNMTNLKVQGGGIELGKIDSDKLETLTLHSGGLTGSAVKSVSDANLPNLTRLEMWFGAEEYGAGGDVKMLKNLLDGSKFPKLTHLGLQNSEFQNDIAKALPNAKILPQLKTLDLSMGTMDAKGAKALIDNKEKFAHLDSIDVSDNFLDEASVNGLKAAFGDKVKIGVQDKFDEHDPEWRYVSVGE